MVSLCLSLWLSLCALTKNARACRGLKTPETRRKARGPNREPRRRGRSCWPVLAPWRSRRDLDDAKTGDRTGTLVLARFGSPQTSTPRPGTSTGRSCWTSTTGFRAGPRSTPVNLPVNLSGQLSTCPVNCQRSGVARSTRAVTAGSRCYRTRDRSHVYVFVSRETTCRSDVGAC